MPRCSDGTIEPGGLPYRVPDGFASLNRIGEDAALEDHVLVHQRGERLSRVVRHPPTAKWRW